MIIVFLASVESDHSDDDIPSLPPTPEAMKRKLN